MAYADPIANREKILAAKKRWREKNKEKEKLQHAERWKKNKERNEAVKAIWRKNNPEKARKTRQKIKARRHYGPFWEAQVIKLEILECLKEQKN